MTGPSDAGAFDPRLVSVILPTWQEESALGACLTAVARNEGPLEIVVVDGGSTDRTVDVARSFAPHGVRVLEGGPRGRGAQMNRGARASRGPLLWFLHADTRPPAGAATAIRRALAEPDIAGGALRFGVDSPRRVFRLLEALVRVRSEWFRLPWGDQGIFLRRETFEAIGGYREEAILEDLHLVRELKRRGRLRLLPLEVRTSPRRWEGGGLVRTTLRNQGVLLLHRLGVSPERLARLRGHDRR